MLISRDPKVGLFDFSITINTHHLVFSRYLRFVEVSVVLFLIFI